MRNLIKALGSVAMLFSITLNASCASSQRGLSPPLEQRTLELHPTLPGVIIYPTTVEKCVRKFLGICTKKEVITEYEIFDTKKPEVLKTLLDKDFVLKVRNKP